MGSFTTLTPPAHLVSPLVCRGPWMSTVVLYCWCHSDSASVLLYFTLNTITVSDLVGLYWHGASVFYKHILFLFLINELILTHDGLLCRTNTCTLLLCRLQSIATQRDHFVRRLSVRLSVCLSVCLSVRSSVCHTPIAMFCSRHMHSSECCHYFIIKRSKIFLQTFSYCT